MMDQGKVNQQIGDEFERKKKESTQIRRMDRTFFFTYNYFNKMYEKKKKKQFRLNVLK
ncbi:hypothetical protein PGB90_004669 [Kerria lacca]